VRQQGRIVSKGEGRWLVRVFVGRDASGKRRYTSKIVRGSKADARKAVTAISQQVNRGVQVEPGKRTLAAYLEDWLKTSAKPRVAENTFRDYGKHLCRHVIPALGSKRLEQVTPAQIRALYQAMADQGSVELFSTPTPSFARRSRQLLRITSSPGTQRRGPSSPRTTARRFLASSPLKRLPPS
jgi:hypothetical protein